MRLDTDTAKITVTCKRCGKKEEVEAGRDGGSKLHLGANLYGDIHWYEHPIKKSYPQFLLCGECERIIAESVALKKAATG